MLKITLGIAFATAAVASPAVAQEPRQVSVGYADLDITTHRGQAKLDRRIEAAIVSVCGDGVWFNAEQYLELKHCMKVADADAQVQRQVAIARAMDRLPAVAMVLLRPTS